MADADEEHNAIEEERRLMYVGMTRAMQQLKISYVKKRQKRYPEEKTASAFGPSRFLDEIPTELSSGHPSVKRSAQEQKINNQKNFAAIKAMLGD